MRRLLFSLIVLALASPVAHGCPLCREAVPSESSTEEMDQMRLARAYNHSIFLMLGMPYFLVGAVGIGFLDRARACAIEHDRNAGLRVMAGVSVEGHA